MNLKTKMGSAWGGVLWIAAVCAVLATPDASAQAIDQVVQSFETAAGGWYSVLLGFAQRLFGILATITLAWAAIKWVMEGEDIKALMAQLVKQIISLGFFWWVLMTAETWVPAILDSFTQAGAAAGGSTALTPSSIISEGLFIASVIPSKTGLTDLFSQPLVVIIAGLASIIVLAGFVIAAVQLAITKIQAAVVLAGGVLLLGFGGSGFTRDFVQKYFSYAISTGVRLLVLYLVLGIAITEANTWGDYLLTADITELNFQPFFVVMANSTFFAFMCWVIPKTAGEMLSGTIDMSAGAVAAGVAGGAVAGAGVVLAGAAAAAPIRGAIQAATAGVKAEQAAGATGTNAILGGIGRAASAMGAEAKASASSYVGLGNKSQYANTSDTIGGRAASRLESEANKATADRAAQTASPAGASSGSAASSSSGQPSASGAGDSSAVSPQNGQSKRSGGTVSPGDSLWGETRSGAGRSDAVAALTEAASVPSADGSKSGATEASSALSEAAATSGQGATASPQGGSTDAAASSTNAAAQPGSTAGGGAPEKSASVSDSMQPGKHQDRDLTNPLSRPDIPPDTGPSAGITIRLDDPD
jgi:type IV secretion system protein TrbL